ncbi:MAG: DUF401 family protein [Thermodesulfovibrionales bacterium]|nr:DUF401 family protein [Thermodesulfovibrionales bacterium]
MPDLIKLLFILTTILILIRKNLNVGLVLLIAGFLLMILYQFDIQTGIITVKQTLLDQNTIKLILALSLIRCFELILRQNDIMSKMMNGIRSMFNNKKIIIVSMPIIIGLLPSLGGAYFSAPMVSEATKDLNMSSEEKSFINYWFRHIWECVLPLYPGIMLVSAITSLDVKKIILLNIPLTLSMIISGFYLSMRGINTTENAESLSIMKDKGFLFSFLPIGVLVIMFFLFGSELYLSLFIINTFLIILYRIRLNEVIKILRYGFSKEIFVLIFGVMFFKQVLELSGAIQNISLLLNSMGLPIFPILLILPFIVGLLTGITVAFVGSTFPLLIGISGGVEISNITFAFASGYVGVLLSPVHLCLLLTRDYFFADLGGIYKKIIPATAFTLFMSILIYLL